jgi:hypothetical protein
VKKEPDFGSRIRIRNIVLFIPPCRRHLVDWTSIVAEKLKLTSTTLHLAIKILDYFMDGHDIQVEDLA